MSKRRVIPNPAAMDKLRDQWKVIGGVRTRNTPKAPAEAKSYSILRSAGEFSEESAYVATYNESSDADPA